MSTTNLASLLVDSARQRPWRNAIKLDDLEVSYEELDEGSARVAALLTVKRLGPGDRVGVMLPMSPTSRSSTTACCAPGEWLCR